MLCSEILCGKTPFPFRFSACSFSTALTSVVKTTLPPSTQIVGRSRKKRMNCFMNIGLRLMHADNKPRCLSIENTVKESPHLLSVLHSELIERRPCLGIRLPVKESMVSIFNLNIFYLLPGFVEQVHIWLHYFIGNQPVFGTSDNEVRDLSLTYVRNIIRWRHGVMIILVRLLEQI